MFIRFLTIASALIMVSYPGGADTAGQVTAAETSMASQIPSLPPLKDYPAPVKALSHHSKGIIYLASKTVGDPKLLIGIAQGATPTTIRASLYRPALKKGEKVPAMVILPGSSGVSLSREIAYAKHFAASGIMAMVMHSFEARSVAGEVPYTLRVMAVSEADLAADAVSAKKLLLTHPNVDTKKIGVLGFSYGGTAVRMLADMRVMKTSGHTHAPFDLLFDFYGPCYLDLKVREASDAMLYSFRGAEDASNDLVRCAEQEQSLRNAGVQVGSTIFPNAAHGWELKTEKQFRSTVNPANFNVALNEQGEWEIQGKPWKSMRLDTREQRFVERLRQFEALKYTQGQNPGYVIGHDETTANKARALVDEMIRSRWQVAK